MHAHQFTDGSAARDFCLAGKAYVTFVSKKSGTRFTFRIARPDENSPWFVGVLPGPSNTRDYTFLGTIFADRAFKHGRKSRIGKDAPSARAFAWMWPILARGELSDLCEVWHDGRCGRCGRMLTDSSSIEAGLGPVCEEKEAA